MEDTYSLTFDWPHTDAHTVIVTGNFDNWSSSVHLQRAGSGFTGSVAVPWETKILYKFVVDSNWITHPSQPTEIDAGGFVNNVVHTPVKPSAPPPPAKPEVAAPEETKKEAVNEEQKPAAPVEVAPKVPIAIQPVLDGSIGTSPDTKPVVTEAEASTHQPASATEVPSAPEPAPEPAPAPSTPPQKTAELPAAAPVTPIKTNGLNSAHARTSTGGTSTAPSSSAPSTPKTQNTFPTTDGGDAGSPGSKFNSLGRQKRDSFFGKLKAKFSRTPEKEKKKRLGSEELWSASPSPRKSDK